MDEYFWKFFRVCTEITKDYLFYINYRNMDYIANYKQSQYIIIILNIILKSNNQLNLRINLCIKTFQLVLNFNSKIADNQIKIKIIIKIRRVNSILDFDI